MTTTVFDTCTTCSTPVGVDDSAPGVLLHLTPEGAPAPTTHTPTLRCEAHDSYGGPHPGCDEYVPPVDHPCTSTATRSFRVHGPFGPEVFGLCTYHSVEWMLGCDGAHEWAPTVRVWTAGVADPEVVRAAWDYATSTCARDEGCTYWCTSEALCQLREEAAWEAHTELVNR